MREFIVNPATSEPALQAHNVSTPAIHPTEIPSMRLDANTDPTKGGKLTSTLDGAMLRLVSHAKSLMQGASPETVAKLGVDRLKELATFFDAENDALTKAAKLVKTAINSSLSVDELRGLGIEKLRELGAQAGVGFPQVDEFTGYSLNAINEAAYKA